MAGVRPAAPRYGFSNKAVALRPSSEKLPGSPIFHLAGVSPADVHNRDPRALPLVSGGVTVIGDEVLAKAQDANVVFCQLAPYAIRIQPRRRLTSANSRRTHVGRDWAGGRPPAPSTLAPTLTPALPRGSQDSSGAADWRSRGFQGRELLLRRIGRKDANKPVVGPSFLGLFFTVASHWDAWQTTAAGLPCSDPRPWRLGSRWSSDIPDGVEESATP